MSDIATAAATTAPTESSGNTDEPTQAPDAAKTVAPVAPAKHKFDFGDGEREYDFDSLKANYLKGRGAAQMLSNAEKKLRSAMELEQKNKGLPERLKNSKDRLKLFEELGIDRRAFAEELLLPEIQRETMSEEERKFAELQSRLQEYEQKDQSRAETERQAKEQAQVAEYQNQLGQKMVEALTKSGLPKSAGPLAVKRIAHHMERALDADYDISPDELAELVRDEYRGEHKSFSANLSGQELVEWLGEDVVRKIRQHDLSKLRSKMGGQMVQAPVENRAPKVTNGSNGKHYLTRDEAKKEFERKLREDM